MRTIKEPEVRKNEILEAAEKLFAANGFEKTTVNDILDKVGIAKGTFYYYFKSKEDALDAIILQRIDNGLEHAKHIAANQKLGVKEKLLAVIMAQKPENSVQEEFNSVLHEPTNALLHQKILIKYVLCLSPILGNIIEDGVKQGVFTTKFPKESSEMILTAALVLFDDGYFQWQPQEMEVKVSAFLYNLERILGTKSNSLANLTQVFFT